MSSRCGAGHRPGPRSPPGRGRQSAALRSRPLARLSSRQQGGRCPGSQACRGPRVRSRYGRSSPSSAAPQWRAGKFAKAIQWRCPRGNVGVGVCDPRAPSLSRPLRRVRPLQGLDADASSAYTGFPAGSPPVPRHPSARLAHSRPDGLEPGQHRRQIRGVVVPEPGMRGGLLQSAGEFDVLVMPGRHDQPRAPGRPAHVPGAHRGRRVCRQEMKHRGQDNGYRLGHIDHGAHPAYRELRA
jgi:hypothetical protein